jgi:hypothetical protein
MYIGTYIMLENRSIFLVYVALVAIVSCCRDVSYRNRIRTTIRYILRIRYYMQFLLYIVGFTMLCYQYLTLY